jgi:hypothetical protein
MDWNPATYAKAIIGSVLSALGTAQLAWQGDHLVDTGEWIGIAISALAVFAGVFGLPNKPADPKGPVA